MTDKAIEVVIEKHIDEMNIEEYDKLVLLL